jgi:hypothetical protein
MLSAFIEDPQELATLEPQIPEDFSYSPELDASDEADNVPAQRIPFGGHDRTGIAMLPRYTAEECAADAARAQRDEPDAAVTASLARADTRPENVFDIVMYSLEPRWPGNFRESEYKCSRWLVAARALQGTGLWSRYVAMEKAAENGTRCVDVELREACGAAWKAAGLHNLGKHLRPPKHRHHAEKPKERKRRKREHTREDGGGTRLWLCPELKEQRAAENNGGIVRGTLR